MPLLMFPFVLSLCTDAWVSLGRVGQFLTAEELEPPYPIDPSRKFAVDVDADFTWEVSDIAKATGGDDKGKGKGGPGAKAKAEKTKAKKEEKANKKKGGDTNTNTPGEPSPSATIVTADSNEIFTLKNLKMHVQNGEFVALVGRIGSGKSSVLNALIGEMRKTRGEVYFNGSISYSPQVPWLANATVRDNILFGNPYDEKR
jgi:ATP-binding cassette, subfamily C (CFTR/MRP), member 1